VPWLDLLAEYDLQIVRVVFLDDGCDFIAEGIKLFLAEGADIVKD
jgi:hypothetical protein